jgi:transposase
VIGLSRRVRVFAYTRPVDMRKQHDGLYALVVAELKADPLSEDLFLFTNRRRKESVEMTLSEPAFFLEGSRLAGALRLSPPPTSRQVLTPFLHETQRC